MEIILQLRNVTKNYSIESKILRRKIGQVAALDGLSFELKKGETLGLVGESGSGKTTAAKLIVGLIKPDTGEILIDSQPWEAFTARDLAFKIQMIFQDPFSSLNPRLSVHTIIGEVIRLRKRHKEGNWKVPETEIKAEILALLQTVGIHGDILDNYPHQFSGGQRQRIAIARALAFKPEIIIADEPLSYLDVSIQSQIMNLFTELKDEFNLTYLFISHDMMLVGYFCDEVLVLRNGKTVEHSLTDSIIRHPQDAYTRKLVDSVI